MPSYLVESYVPRALAGEQREAAIRARAAAHALTTEGVSVRYLRSIFVPADETCFHLFEAGFRESAEEASRRAAISVERVVEAVDVAPAEGDLIETSREE
jgi:hypothetical protein